MHARDTVRVRGNGAGKVVYFRLWRLMGLFLLLLRLLAEALKLSRYSYARQCADQSMPCLAKKSKACIRSCRSHVGWLLVHHCLET